MQYVYEVVQYVVQFVYEGGAICGAICPWGWCNMCNMSMGVVQYVVQFVYEGGAIYAICLWVYHKTFNNVKCVSHYDKILIIS